MIYENELWHSFLFRTQIIYNISNYRNIISAHGALRYDAFPKLELIDVYKSHINQELYDALATVNGYILTSSARYFRNGVYTYFDTMEYAYNNGFLIRNSYPMVNISRIRYCYSCIREDICTKGVGYIRHKWLFESKCCHHNHTLYEFCFNNYSDTVKGLSELIVSGVNPSGYYSLIVDICNPFETPVYLLPCSYGRFRMWILENKVELAHFLYDFFKKKSYSSLKCTIDVKIMQGAYLSAVARMLSEVDFCNFNDFIKNEFVHTSYASEGLPIFSLNINFLKLKGRVCGDCKKFIDRVCPLFNVNHRG
ncbi:hypothetical protein [Escherichia coli]|uniref:hypothetical protein n=1 Tax=Escherichia coli TaxID=562 RepID=UPI001365C787|nr:hypothetical protein [Escherichia coli]MWT73275.1 hypothetical protein [Escherichia coli]